FRASIVCEESLYYFAENLYLQNFVLLGKGEERTGGRKRQALLADVFEAFLGAIYLDQGIAISQMFLEKWRSEEHTSELQSRFDLVCRLLLEKKKKKKK